MGIAFSASGSMNDARMPVWVKAKGPSSLRQIQCDSEFMSAGKIVGRADDGEFLCGAGDRSEHAFERPVGDARGGGSWQMANWPGTKVNFSTGFG